MSDVAALVGAVAALATAILTPVVLIYTVRVRNEVRTYNEKPMGRLAAEDETRRVEAIDHDDRTLMEQRHVDESPPRDPPQGPPR